MLARRDVVLGEDPQQFELERGKWFQEPDAGNAHVRVCEG
jgi:hypothetical protein